MGIKEQEGLPGFLLHKPHALGWFNQLKTEGNLQEILAIYEIEDSETFLSELKEIESSDDQETFLKENHKFLFCEALKNIGRDDDLMLFAKTFRDSYKDYTLYVWYYLPPWFESLRRANLLTQGSIKLIVNPGEAERNY